MQTAPATIPPPRVPGQPMTSTEQYLEARLNAAVADLEACRGERDKARANLTDYQRAAQAEIARLKEALCSTEAHVSGHTNGVINVAVDELAASEQAAQDLRVALKELPCDSAVFYTGRDLQFLEAFAAGAEFATDWTPTGRSLRVLRVAISNARQELANR